MKKKILIVAAILTIATVCCVALSACKPMFDSAADYKVGISQFVEHPALDKAAQGFTTELNKLMEAAGKKVDIVLKNAQNDQSNCKTIANAFVSNKADLILGIATPAAQAVASATKTIPVLFTAVTDAVDNNLVESNDRPGGNVTGTSDMNPVDKQIRLMKRLVPDATKFGILYCTSEKNSLVQKKLAEATCKELGITLVDGGISDQNDLNSGMSKLKGCDAIYIPTDNIIAKSIENVANINKGEGYKKVIVCGEQDPTKIAGIATYGVDYTVLGAKAAQMAFDILVNGKKPADIPVLSLENETELYVNTEMAKTLGFTIPQEVLDEFNRVND